MSQVFGVIIKSTEARGVIMTLIFTKEFGLCEVHQSTWKTLLRDAVVCEFLSFVFKTARRLRLLLSSLSSFDSPCATH